MRPIYLPIFLIVAATAIAGAVSRHAAGPYNVLKTAKGRWRRRL